MVMVESRCSAICSLLIHFSLITYRVWCSRALNSLITPSYNRWSTSPGSTAKFNPTPLRELIVGLSSSFSMASAPLGSTSMLETFARNILAASEVPIVRLVDIVPDCDAWVCSPCRPIWIAPNINYCYFSNCCRDSMVTSCTVSPMS